MQEPPDLPARGAGQDFLRRLRYRAYRYHYQGDLEAAQRAYQQILAISPGDIRVRQALGVLALATRNYPWALQLLSQVAQTYDSADLQDHLGIAYFALSRLGESLRCYERAIAIQSDHVSARVHRTQVLQALGRFKDAAAPATLSRQDETHAVRDSASTHRQRREAAPVCRRGAKLGSAAVLDFAGQT